MKIKSQQTKGSAGWWTEESLGISTLEKNNRDVYVTSLVVLCFMPGRFLPTFIYGPDDFPEESVEEIIIL